MASTRHHADLAGTTPTAASSATTRSPRGGRGRPRRAPPDPGHQAGDLALRWNCKAGRCGSCSAEINGLPRLMCMTRMNELPLDEPITVAPLEDVPDHPRPRHGRVVQLRDGQAGPAFAPGPKEADGTYRMQQEDIDRVQEFHKCIECFLCQNVCHVIRDHEENKQAFAGPRMFIRYAELEMHPLDTNDRREPAPGRRGLGMCNITKCCTEVCPADPHHRQRDHPDI